MINKQYIKEILEATLSSDEISNLIENKVKETVKESIEDEFKLFKDEPNLGKFIQSEIQKTVSLHFRDIKIPDFQAMIIQSINTGLETIAKEELKGILENNIKKMLVKDIEEISITKLVYEFLSEINKLPSYDDCSCYEYVTEDSFELEMLDDIDITFLVEISKDFIHVYLDHKNDKEWYSCEYNLWTYKNIVSSVKIPGNQSVLDKIKGFDLLMFKLNSQSAKLTISEDELDIIKYGGYQK